jgi:hypothetical protein
MPSPDTFPREYLLRVYNAALDHGHILLHPITREDAARFTACFYRLRRRSDAAHQSFITPEMHLVTVGKWKEVGGIGILPIYYTTLPEGETLPMISPAAGTQVFSPADPDLDPIASTQIDDYIQQLASKAHKRTDLT